MKRAYILAVVLVLSAAMLASLIGAAAAQTVYFVDLEVSFRGIVWRFNTQEALPEPFSGKDIVKGSVVAKTWDEEGVETILDPLVIITTKKCVILIFLPRELPDYETAGTEVTGMLENGDEFIATGPGFAWGRR